MTFHLPQRAANVGSMFMKGRRFYKVLLHFLCLWFCPNNRVRPLKKPRALWEAVAGDPLKLSWPHALLCCSCLSTSLPLSSRQHSFTVSRHPFNDSFVFSKKAFTEHLVTTAGEPLQRRGDMWILDWGSSYSYTTEEKEQVPVCSLLTRSPSSPKPNRWRHSGWFPSYIGYLNERKEEMEREVAGTSMEEGHSPRLWSLSEIWKIRQERRGPGEGAGQGQWPREVSVRLLQERAGWQ